MLLKLKSFAFLGVIIYLSACGNRQTVVTELEPDAYPVVKVIRQDISIPLEYVTVIQAYQNVEIRARVEGYLEKILVDEGQIVRKGQLLFQINAEEYNAELNRARANVISAEAETKSAQVELERVKLLVDRNVVTKTELELANAQLEIAKSKVIQAKAEESIAAIKVANTLIKSPFDGVIDRIPFKIGSLINAGTLLTNLSDVSSVYAYFDVSEREYLSFFYQRQTDQAFRNNVEMILADGSIYPLKGKIETMESQFEAGTGSISIRAKFENPKGMVKHGSTGKIRLQEVRGNALLIPQKSTLEIQDQNYVLAVDPSNMVMMKSFRPLRRYGEYYLVGEGLTEDDWFVFEGIQNVREGMVIKPQQVNIAAPGTNNHKMLSQQE